ncbi:MAG: fatty acid desaturase [Gammaproteobacteria bacterium]|nr:fatty acid desaturase [Gammaproteobacteria bacterium]
MYQAIALSSNYQNDALASHFHTTETTPDRQADLTRMKQEVAAFRGGDTMRSSVQLGLTSLSLVFSFSLAVYSVDNSVGLSLLFSTLAALCILRLFMIQHDCGHGAFFQSRRANDVVGRIIGVITLTPYQCWRRFHAMHHAGTGNLEKRGYGDIKTLTVREYQALSPRAKLLYRLFRHPAILFGVLPFVLFFVRQRLTYYIPKNWIKERKSVHYTNAGIAVVAIAMSFIVGLEAFLSVYVPAMIIAASIGVWLFYVQHQFEDAYWESQTKWTYNEAAVYGSSYYKLPQWAQWLFAHITVHHVHHLDCTIPNYRLKECNERVSGLKDSAPGISFRQSLETIRYKLWDEQKKQMVSFNY